MPNRPDPADFLRNLRKSDLPVREKIRLTVKNNAIKLARRSNCCGNHGEPGC